MASTGICISFLCMAISIVYSSLLLLLLGRAFSGLMAGSQPIAQAAIADLNTEKTKARNMSIIALSCSIGAVFGPVLGGVTSDTAIASWFNYSTPFFIAAGLAFISVCWLLISFKATFVTEARKKVSLLRPIKIFIEAFEHKSVRLLAIIFLLMQIGFSL